MTAAATEKQVKAGMTTSRRDDNDLSAVSVTASAAVPDEKEKTCRIRNSRRKSSSSARVALHPAIAPASPCQASIHASRAAAGGSVRPILMRAQPPAAI